MEASAGEELPPACQETFVLSAFLGTPNAVPGRQVVSGSRTTETFHNLIEITSLE